jgi:hypothetical protein
MAEKGCFEYKIPLETISKQVNRKSDQFDTMIFRKNWFGNSIDEKISRQQKQMT